jgi:NAD kinase
LFCPLTILLKPFFRSAAAQASEDDKMMSYVKVFHGHKRHTVKLVLVVGDNSTTRLASSLFPDMVPPMVGFQVGLNEVKADFKTILETVIQSSEVKIVKQTRLQCEFPSSARYQAVSEVTLYRGNYPKVIYLLFN